MNLLLRLVITTIAVILTSLLLPGVYLDGFLTALLVAFILSLLNIFVKPLLILLTIPFTILTFGLFLLVINAGLILLASKFVGGFYVDGFWWALAFSLILSLISSLLGMRRAERGDER